MKENPTVGSIFSGRFFLTASLRKRRMSEYIALYTVAIPVNYPSEFREILKLLRIKYLLLLQTRRCAEFRSEFSSTRKGATVHYRQTDNTPCV